MQLTWVIGSFMMSTSVTDPNCPKYSLSLSGVVCQDKPPTKSFPIKKKISNRIMSVEKLEEEKVILLTLN